MSVATRELRRRPGRFAFVGIALALLSTLLLLLGGLLDGLVLGSTGAFRAQDAPVFVYSADAQDSFLRSRITPAERDQIAAAPGVTGTAGLGLTLDAGRLEGTTGTDNLLDLAVMGYEQGTDVLPTPPGTGEAYADTALEADGVTEGSTILVGLGEIPVRVVGFVDDSNYLLQPALWVDLDTWRQIQTASRPDAAIADGVVQVVLVDGTGTPESLVAAVDDATGGATSSLTRDEAIFSLPGTAEQNATFTALIGTTIFVVGLITSLFFILLTVERRSLYAAMKALGVGTGALVRWSMLQALLVAGTAFVLGGLVTLGLAQALAGQIPLLLEPTRAVVTFVLLLATAAIGSLIPLRRIIRIDPASAIS